MYRWPMVELEDKARAGIWLGLKKEKNATLEGQT